METIDRYRYHHHDAAVLAAIHRGATWARPHRAPTPACSRAVHDPGRAGKSAAAGFLLALLRDARGRRASRRRPGAQTLVGFSSSWAKRRSSFAEHVFVKGSLFFAGTGFRNFIRAARPGKLQGSQVAWELLVWSAAQAQRPRWWVSASCGSSGAGCRRTGRRGGPLGARRERVFHPPCSTPPRARAWIGAGT